MGSPALRIAGNTAQPTVSMLPWTFALQTNSREAEKRIRQARVLLRIFVCFDIFILIGGILNLVWITPTSENLLDMQHTFVYCTVAFFSLTLICNSLAIHGISKQKRLLLLPWLVIFLVLKIFLIVLFITDVLYNPLNLGQLMILLLSVMSAWRHMQAQSCLFS